MAGGLQYGRGKSIHLCTMRRLLLLASLICVTAGKAPTVRSEPEFVIVVNESNPAAALPASEVAQLFLKKKTKWPSGANVVPVDQQPGHTREAFSREVLGRDISAVRAYWQQQIFSGRSTAPEEKPSDAAVIAFVKESPGGIGYVSASAATTGVKILPTR